MVVSVGGEGSTGNYHVHGCVQLPRPRLAVACTLWLVLTILPAPCPLTAPLRARSIDFGTLEGTPEDASPDTAPSLGRQLVDASSKIFRYVQLGQTSAYVGLQVGTGVPCRKQTRADMDPCGCRD